MDLVDLFGEVELLLLVDDPEARLAHQAPDDVQVSAHAAVHLVGDDAFVRYVVFDDDESVGPKGFLAALQEVHQVVVCQVTWSRRSKARQGVTQTA